MSEQDALETSFEREFDHGFEVKTIVNQMTLYVSFYLGNTDFDCLPAIIPASRFEEGFNVHVGQLNQQTPDIADEMESILANMDDNDTVVFFCESEAEIAEGLTFLNFSSNDHATH
ncbi:hypothetical protein [Pelistega ratti]|uniref:hypothetical protein n=1 Tax=Pelistega ratti TaxID=2652177 RepID=UPI00135CA148|nr:hypothetical protein [Pelistega ratti]